jgi:hypothetical protein
MIDHVIERERCRRDAHHFIFESRALKTKDEHDHQNPTKAVPDHLYLRVVIDCLLVGSKLIHPAEAKYALEVGMERSFLDYLHRSGVLFIEKSRDLFVTNIVSCFIHWRAKYIPYQLILVQSKNEDDAANLVFNKEPDAARISFQEYHLPDHLKSTNLNRCAYARVSFDNGSRIRGIPEGARVIRSEHPSMVFGDEGGFQDEFDASFTAALPAVQGGGFFLSVSSAEPGSFENIVKPNEPNTATRLGGFSYRLAQETIPVLRVHYSCHPERVPGTVIGEEWKADAQMRYPGGADSPRWKKEMEIDYGALSGTRLLPHWEQWKANGRIVIEPFRPVGYRLYASYDHGWRNPAAYHVHGVSPDGDIVTLWEFYGNFVPAHQIAQIIKGKSIITEDGRKFPGNPYAGEERFKVADPSIWAEDVPQSDKTNKSTAWIFEKCGVFFQEGERGGDTTVAEWLLGYFWRDPERPLYRITTACPKLIWELGQQRFKQLSEQVALNKDQPEELVDKDNHAWDGIKMFLKRFPPPEYKKKPDLQANTLAWWKKQMQRQSQGLPQRTYRIPVNG